MDEPEICARSSDLASLCSPGEYYVPKWVQSMYYAMGRYGPLSSVLGMSLTIRILSIFGKRPDIWNRDTNTWVESGFVFEGSDGQPDARLEEIYCQAKYDAEWAIGLYDGDI
jgi:hypothetical protein